MWKRKVIKPERSKFTVLELALFEFLIEILPENEAVKTKGQLSYMVYFQRIRLKSKYIVEISAETLSSIPSNYLFGRTEEFELARFTFSVSDFKYEVKVGAVLGRIFDIEIKPIDNLEFIDITTIRFYDPKYSNDIDKNTHPENIKTIDNGSL